MTYVPDAVVIDFAPIIFGFRHSLRRFVKNDEIYMNLVRFFQVFTVQDVLKAVLMQDRYLPGHESTLWMWIEHKFPDGIPDVEDDNATLEMLNYVMEDLTLQADSLVDQVLHANGISSQYETYLFKEWISPSAALLTHKRYSVETYYRS